MLGSSSTELSHQVSHSDHTNLLMLVRGKGKPDRVILDIFANLNQENEKHDIYGLYEGRLRSHAENFEVGVGYNSPRAFVTSISPFI